MFTLDTILCCLGLRWGILIIAIVDIAICSVGIYDSEKLALMDYTLLTLSVYVAHIIGCILILISVLKVCYPKD